ncbi:MAG: hypothetical protein ACI4GY_08185 [Acutalibacteraceae bacterium]
MQTIGDLKNFFTMFIDLIKDFIALVKKFFESKDEGTETTGE